MFLCTFMPVGVCGLLLCSRGFQATCHVDLPSLGVILGCNKYLFMYKAGGWAQGGVAVHL